MNLVLNCLLAGVLFGGALSSAHHGLAIRQVEVLPLTLSTKLDQGLVSIYNNKGTSGLLLDLNANLMLLASSEYKHGLLLNPSTKVVHYITSTHIPDWWASGHSLAKLPDYVNGIVATEVQHKLVLNDVLPSLCHKSAKNLHELHKRVKFLENFNFLTPFLDADIREELNPDLFKVDNILGGVVKMVKKVGVDVLQDKEFVLPLDEVLVAKTGVERFARIIQSMLWSGVDVKLVQPLLEQPHIYSHLALLGGNVWDHTIDGFNTVVHNLIKVSKKCLKPEEFIDQLYNKPHGTIDVNVALKPLHSLAGHFPTLLKDVQKFTTSMLKDEINVGDVKVMKLRTHMKHKRKHVRNALLFNSIQKIVPLEFSTPYFLKNSVNV